MISSLATWTLLLASGCFHGASAKKLQRSRYYEGEKSRRAVSSRRKLDVADTYISMDMSFMVTESCVSKHGKKEKGKKGGGLHAGKRRLLETPTPISSPPASKSPSTKPPSSTSKGKRLGHYGEKGTGNGSYGKKGGDRVFCEDYCDLLDGNEFPETAYMISMALSVADEANAVAEYLDMFYNEDIAADLAVCFNYTGDESMEPVWTRRQLKRNGTPEGTILVSVSTISHNPTECEIADHYKELTGKCAIYNVFMDVVYDLGTPAQFEEVIYRTIVNRCQDFSLLPGVEEGFFPCPYISVNWMDPESSEQGNTSSGAAASESVSGENGTEGDSGTQDDKDTSSPGPPEIAKNDPDESERQPQSETIESKLEEEEEEAGGGEGEEEAEDNQQQEKSDEKATTIVFGENSDSAEGKNIALGFICTIFAIGLALLAAIGWKLRNTKTAPDSVQKKIASGNKEDNRDDTSDGYFGNHALATTVMASALPGRKLMVQSAQGPFCVGDDEEKLGSSSGTALGSLRTLHKQNSSVPTEGSQDIVCNDEEKLSSSSGTALGSLRTLHKQNTSVPTEGSQDMLRFTHRLEESNETEVSYGLSRGHATATTSLDKPTRNRFSEYTAVMPPFPGDAM